MNKDLYHNNDDYRKGYNDGVEETRKQMLQKMAKYLTIIKLSCDGFLETMESE